MGGLLGPRDTFSLPWSTVLLSFRGETGLFPMITGKYDWFVADSSEVKVDSNNMQRL